ncbi:MAG TPA: hypothetical protein DG761_08300 [Gammaproteobacteria bacterium]|nr:hypothetical protein [Gammaproteobacteria bacterium]
MGVSLSVGVMRGYVSATRAKIFPLPESVCCDGLRGYPDRPQAGAGAVLAVASGGLPQIIGGGGGFVNM